jgi:hypothetical protein
MAQAQAQDFHSLLNDLLIDLDGDGVPDATAKQVLDRQYMDQLTGRARPQPRPDVVSSQSPAYPYMNALMAGAIPAREFVGQAQRAGRAISDAQDDPTLANVTDAGFQSALALGRPIAAAGAAGLGILEAVRRDFAPDIFPQSRAAGDPLDAAQRKRLTALQKKSGTRRGLTPGEEDEMKTLNEIVRDVTIRRGTAGAQAESERLANEEAQRAADAKRKSEEDAAARGRANSAYAAGLATDRRFSDTETGRIFDKFGPLAPGAVAAGTGAITGAGLRGSGITSKAALYGVPAAVGTLAGFASAHWPQVYEANYAPNVNPSYQAALNYIREAPADDPRSAQLRGLIDSGTISPTNPVRAEAEANLYDPQKFKERSLVGAIEGVVGGLAGGEVLPAIKYGMTRLPAAAYEVGKVPGSMARGYADGFRRSAASSASRSAAPIPPANTPAPPPAGPPGYGQGPPQAPPPAGRVGARGTYGPQDQALIRPFIESEVAAGRNVPSTADLVNMLGGRQMPAAFGERVSNADAFVASLRHAGVPDSQIAEALRNAMNNGMRMLPAAAATAGLSYNMPDQEPGPLRVPIGGEPRNALMGGYPYP